MLKAILRYLFFIIPSSFLRGLEFIIFDKEEVISAHFVVQDQYDKEIEKRKILLEHLERCRKQVFKKGN